MIGSASALSTSATLHSAPPVVGTSPSAATNAFSSAAPRSVSMPITSPVDFISGPSAVSTSISLTVENTGALTATSGRAGTSPVVQPSSASVAPRITRVASSTIGTPVTLLRNGTVREARGLTSSTCGMPRWTANWMLQRPRTSSARAMRTVASTIRARTSSPRIRAGYAAIESPLCTPARSTCSMSPGMTTVSPSLMASTSTSVPKRYRSMSTVPRRRAALGGERRHRGLEIALQLAAAVHDLHRAPAEHVRRSHQHREADARRRWRAPRRDRWSRRPAAARSTASASAPRTRAGPRRGRCSRCCCPRMVTPARSSGSARLIAV